MIATRKRLYLSSPTMHGPELEYMQEAYHTNWMSTVGANLNAIEEEFCRLVGCKYAVALSSGTAALHLAVKLAGVQPGQRVFCSDLTFAASVNPVAYEKGLPVFIDSEADTWNMDPEALERAFARFPDTKVVLVANLYGTPAKFDDICAIAQQHGAVIIEDAAESLGATLLGRQTGTFGTYNAISFNGNKIITGSAGGMLLTDDPVAAANARKWATQSREDAPWYQHNDLGYNYRMSNVVAGVVRGQVPYLQTHIDQKKAVYYRYQEAFRDLPIAMNPFDEGTMVPNYWLSCMTVHPDAMCRQERSDLHATYIPERGKTCPTQILQALSRENMEGRPLWKPMHMQPVFRDAPFFTRVDGLCVSEDLFARGLCLPSDNKLTPEEQDAIIAVVRSCFR